MHPDSFDLIVLPLRHKLYRFAFMLVNNRPEAEDIVQDALMKLWLKREDLRKVENVEAWSMTMVKNMAYDRLRQQKRHNDFSLSPENIKSETVPAENIMEIDEKLNHIHRYMETLPERQKQAIFLREIEGHSYKEISDIMGIDENLVKVTLFRARDNLRKKILKIENYGL